MEFKEFVGLLTQVIERGGSDVYIVPGSHITAKINGMLVPLSEEKLTIQSCEQTISEIYKQSNNRDMSTLYTHGDDDFSLSLSQLGRFRCNIYKQRGSLAAVLRAVPFGLPDAKQYHIPDVVLNMYSIKRGMVLVTGPGGSGKTTTLACMIDRINRERSGHIITLEDPIEYIHPHKQCIVSQREIVNDTETFAKALRAALRQVPDVILLGEMRDYETIQTALTAAETGHLLLSTLHTVGAAKTIDRIVDVFPANQQQQVRIQLSMVLQAVVSQQLIPTVDGGLAPAFEIMVTNSAIQNIIREGKGHQLDNAIYAGAAQGMRTMDGELLRLYKEKRISKENTLLYAINPDTLERKLAM
ncbi:MAG: PilT/PilU family type 4a pilus ATPase [Oscillospiraceae bacterium]|jgi:twitching motility protein PilT|nr:PilT/PilU family type 4a pilus ATPase [Oscillospiraceae bacterium]